MMLEWRIYVQLHSLQGVQCLFARALIIWFKYNLYKCTPLIWFKYSSNELKISSQVTFKREIPLKEPGYFLGRKMTFYLEKLAWHKAGLNASSKFSLFINTPKYRLGVLIKRDKFEAELWHKVNAYCY